MEAIRPHIMSTRLRLGSLLHENLPAQNIPPHVSAAIVHHLSQHLEAITAKTGMVQVYHLSIDGCDSSNGKGIFMGPMRTGTAAERDVLAATLPGMPADFRTQLDGTGVLIAVIAQAKKKHTAVILLTEANLATLRGDQ